MSEINKDLIVKWEDINFEYGDISNCGEYDDGEMTIKDGLEIWELRETIIHELIHCIFEKYYYTRTSDPVIDPKIEEQLVCILANEIDKNLDTILYKVKRYKIDKKKKWLLCSD